MDVHFLVRQHQIFGGRWHQGYHSVAPLGNGCFREMQSKEVTAPQCLRVSPYVSASDAAGVVAGAVSLSPSWCTPVLYSIAVRVGHVARGGVTCVLLFLVQGRSGPMWEGA
jgi:hypothetical protein